MSSLIRSVIAAAAIAAGSLGATLATSSVAFACDMVGPSLTTIHEPIQRSSVVAIGTWLSSTERVAVFRVDEALKGTDEGEQFRVDNRGTYTAMACSPYDEAPHSGFRFAEGERSVLVLEREVDGLWQVGHLGLAAFDVSADENDGMVMDWYALEGREQPIEGAPTLASVREAAAAPSLAPERTPNLSVDDNRTSWRETLVAGVVVLGMAGAGLAFAARARSRRGER